LLVNAVRPSLGQRLFEAAEKIGYLVAAYGFLAVAALAATAAVIKATGEQSRWPGQTDTDTTTLVIMAFLMVVGQYILAKIRSASLRIIRTSPSATSSRHLLDCTAVLLLLGSVAVLAAAIVEATKAADAKTVLTEVVKGLLGSVVLVLTASLALNPETLNVSIRPRESAGGEALGLVSFATKLVIRAAPLLIGGMIVISAVGLVRTIMAAIEFKSGSLLVAFADQTCTLMIKLTLGYLLLYVICLYYHLCVDAVRAVFKIRDNTSRDK